MLKYTVDVEAIEKEKVDVISDDDNDECIKDENVNNEVGIENRDGD